MIRRGSLILAVVLLATAPVLTIGAFAESPDDVTFATSPLTVETAQGSHSFVVELAETSQQRAYGLMFRRELPPDHGMLFLYPREDRVIMWMKNTYVPLDMLFIEASGRITRIAKSTTPLAVDLIPSGRAVKAVLELPGGTAARLKIHEGDRVVHPAFAAERKTP